MRWLSGCVCVPHKPDEQSWAPETHMKVEGDSQGHQVASDHSVQWHTLTYVFFLKIWYTHMLCSHY